MITKRPLTGPYLVYSSQLVLHFQSSNVFVPLILVVISGPGSLIIWNGLARLSEQKHNLQFIITWDEPARHGYKVSESFVFVYNMAELWKCSIMFTKWYIQQHLRLKFPKQIRAFGLSPEIRRCYKKEWTNNLIMPATVSPGQPCCAIIWKFSARFAGIPDGCYRDLGKPGWKFSM